MSLPVPLTIIIGSTTITSAERMLVERTFAFHRGNKIATARTLGISLKTLYNKFARYAESDNTIPRRVKVNR